MRTHNFTSTIFLFRRENVSSLFPWKGERGDASERALKSPAPIVKSSSRSVDGLVQNEILQGRAHWDDAHPRLSAKLHEARGQVG